MYAYNNYINNVTLITLWKIPTISKIGEAFAVICPSSPVSTILPQWAPENNSIVSKRAFITPAFQPFVSFKHFFLVLHVLHNTHMHTLLSYFLYFLSDEVIFCQFRFVKFIISTCSPGLFIFTAIFYHVDISQIGDPFSTDNLLGCF